MALYYVYSGAAGGATGADWANAFTTLAAAASTGAAGDTFYVAHNHAETQASAMTITFPGSASNPNFVYCVNSAGTVPPVSADLAATGSVTTTGANAMTFVGFAYFYGLIFSCGTTASAANMGLGSTTASRFIFERCNLVIASTNSGSGIVIGSSGAVAYSNTFINTKVKFAAVGQSMLFNGGFFYWKNTATAVDAAGSIPTSLFTSTAGRGAFAVIEGVDLSALSTGKTIFAATIGATQYRLKDCKLDSAVTIAATPTAPGAKVIVSRCLSTAGNYIEQLYAYEGTQTDELTIVRTGGASDGTTPKSRKVVTTANAKPVAPFEAIPIAIWNDTVGSAITVTVHGIWGGGSVPNNNEVWMDVEYLGATGTPQGSFATAGRADLLASATALAADTSTWGGSTTDFTMSCTFTPQQKGYVYIYPKVGKASDTVYLDPKITIA